MRARVPTYDECETTIRRESRYWARMFRGLVEERDLAQEARVLLISKVHPAFDPDRGVNINTLLTTVLRREFARKLRVTLLHVFAYRHEQRETLHYVLRETSTIRPALAIEARDAIARLRTLSVEYQRLAFALENNRGIVQKAAVELGWSASVARKRVQHLRALLSEHR